MLQLLSLLTMEPPTAFEAHRVRNEKVKVLDATQPPALQEVAAMAVRAQGPGVVGGVPVPGNGQEHGVAPDSPTESYAALKLTTVTLKPVPHFAFRGFPRYPAGSHGPGEGDALLVGGRRWRRRRGAR